MANCFRLFRRVTHVRSGMGAREAAVRDRLFRVAKRPTAARLTWKSRTLCNMIERRAPAGPTPAGGGPKLHSSKQPFTAGQIGAQMKSPHTNILAAQKPWDRARDDRAAGLLDGVERFDVGSRRQKRARLAHHVFVIFRLAVTRERFLILVEFQESVGVSVNPAPSQLIEHVP